MFNPFGVFWIDLQMIQWIWRARSWIVLLTTEHTFIYFSSSVKHRKRNSPRVLFKLFSDSRNMKILSSACPFQLVNKLEMTSTQYKFNAFPDRDRLRTKKEYVDRTWSIGSLLYYFMIFRTWETNWRKRTCGVLFLSLFQTL